MGLVHCSGVKLYNATGDLRENTQSSPFKRVFHKQITTRASAAAILIMTPLTCAVDTISAIGLTLSCIFTGGAIPSLNRKAEHFIQACAIHGQFLAMQPLILINPSADLGDIDGLDYTVTERLRELRRQAQNFSEDYDSFFARHIASRILYLVYTITSIITRILDLAIGIICTIGALFTLGMVPKLNTIAIQNMGSGFSLIHTIYFGITKTINPESYLSKHVF